MIDKSILNKKYTCPICGSEYFSSEGKSDLKCVGCRANDFKNLGEFDRFEKKPGVYYINCALCGVGNKCTGHDVKIDRKEGA